MKQLNIIDLIDGVRKLEQRISVALMYSGIRIPQLRTLNVIDEEGRVTVTALSKRLGVTRATASIMVNELISSGIVYSVENETDRRSFYVKLTISGKQKLNVARGDLMEFQKSLSRDLSEELIVSIESFIGYVRKTGNK
ncbi:MAG: MarR family transcriptional regulator [Proteobacteria bacterium]|nr:MarR family transcriptional regulator [Pseudomonadota bacterium]